MRITAVDERRDRITVALARAGRRGMTTTLELARLRTVAPGLRRPALRLAYAMHPNPVQGSTVERSASLGHPVADRNATYVADTRAVYGHTVHLSREDLGIDGTDADRFERYAEAIASSRSESASIRYRASPGRELGT